MIKETPEEILARLERVSCRIQNMTKTLRQAEANSEEEKEVAYLAERILSVLYPLFQI